MDTIEKINSIFKSVRNGLSKALDFIIKIKDIILAKTSLPSDKILIIELK